MACIYLVRHGQAAAGFDQDHDPGLSELGHAQARAASDTLRPEGPLNVISSPLRRCRETSAPLCDAWNVSPKIINEIAEIPSPTEDLNARTEWLRAVMPGSWRDIGDPALEVWRQNAINAVKSLNMDTVVFSHFIAINVIVGHIRNDDRLVVFRPDNCSITSIDVVDGTLSLHKLGAEAETQVR